MTVATIVRTPDDLASLRDSFALHLDATRQPATRRTYLAALDALIAYLTEHGMPTSAGAVRREHIEAYIALRRDQVKPASLSIAFRGLQQFWKWAVEEEEVERSPMERIRPPRSS